MSKTIIKFKKLDPNAKIPEKAHITDAGYDLVAISKTVTSDYSSIEYGTGIAVEIPKDHVGLLFPRSSVYKRKLLQTNCVGVIDSGYRGEIKVHFRYILDGTPYEPYSIGDKCCQLIIVPIPEIDFVEVSELSDSDRAENGFGSTDITFNSTCTFQCDIYE